mgnify:FL=1
MAPLTRIGVRDVLFVMAVDAEYGPHLRARFTPLFTGVGPVEAALVMGEALTRLALAGTLPDLVVSLGSAGSARLAHGAVYQASSVSWRDIDASALGFPRGVTPFSDLPATLRLTQRIPGIPDATLSTGADVVSGAAYAGIAEDMVDMETWSIARACMRAAVPLIALRGISDGQSDLKGLNDWADYLPLIDAELAKAVDLLS